MGAKEENLAESMQCKWCVILEVSKQMCMYNNIHPNKTFLAEAFIMFSPVL